MKEDFPIFLWRYQVFLKNNLSTTQFNSLRIIHHGSLNTDAGPDFNHAKLIIDNMLWIGDVEIHVRSSHWRLHKHQHDPAYNKVILHVVWEHDAEVCRHDGSQIPTLELKSKVKPSMLSKYYFLRQNLHKIPCYPEILKTNSVIKSNMMAIAVMTRLERKAIYIHQLYQQQCSWEEIAYRVVARNFGFKINAEAFLRLSEVLPWRLLKRHGDNLFQLEAFLMGMAGLLTNSMTNDLYFEGLKKEFKFLCHKYNLQDKIMSNTYWKFFRTRPINFPTIRIAQFAKLCFQHYSLFSIFKDLNSSEDYLKAFSISQSDYWKKHYYFGKVSTNVIPDLGRESINNIIGNAIVNLKVAYGKIKDDQLHVDNAIDLLEQLPAEKNKIIRMWQQNGVYASNAFETQGLIELFQSFCVGKKCLNCNIGISILKTV